MWMRTYKTVGFSAHPDMADEIDKRAKSLGLSRSTYLQQLIRADLGEDSLLHENQTLKSKNNNEPKKQSKSENRG